MAAGKSNRLTITLTALAVLLALPGCKTQTAATKAPPPQMSAVTAALDKGHHVYECSGNLYAVDQLKGAVRFYLPTYSRKLRQVRAASGSRYEDDAVMFWSKGKTAQLSFEGGPAQDCTRRTDIGPWEMARLRHVTFRAIGQEPGWALEIAKGRDIHFVGDHGKTSITAKLPPPITEPGRGRTEYYATTQNHDLGVIIEKGACTDTMSGEAYDAMVSIELDGMDYMGCGKAL